MSPEKDHDVLVVGKNSSVMVTKVFGDHASPHADGCVGCRRAGVCVRCGEKSLLSNGRCVSGMCFGCCMNSHAHVNGPLSITAAR
jgi:hypothetical protein